jgi:hypothetical protein
MDEAEQESEACNLESLIGIHCVSVIGPVHCASFGVITICSQNQKKRAMALLKLLIKASDVRRMGNCATLSLSEERKVGGAPCLFSWTAMTCRLASRSCELA